MNIQYNNNIALVGFGGKSLRRTCIVAIYGKPRSGKTSLANSIAFYLRNLGFNVNRVPGKVCSISDTIGKLYYSDFPEDFIVIDTINSIDDVLKLKSNPTIDSVIIRRQSSFEDAAQNTELDLYDNFDVIVSVVGGIDLTGKDVNIVAKDIIKETLKNLDKIDIGDIM